MKQKKGFLLVEVMVALVIMSAFLALLATSHWHTIQKNRSLFMRSQALHKASSVVEGLLVAQNISPYKQYEDEKFVVTVETKPYLAVSLDEQLGFAAQYPKKFVVVQTTVAWKTVNALDQSIQLVTGRSL